ncbi:MAG TPA: hypothetical protein VK918_07650 [Pyrinomonadaceae bacterium]|nr:hypothetical protein [Pyrinomonadaceae bacterium]
MPTHLIKFTLLIAVLFVTHLTAAAQQPVMWEKVNVAQRDTYWGAGGKAMQPDLRRVKFIRRQEGGNNLKYRIEDASGKVWVAKIADESQPEVVANRLLWAIGYKTEIDYLVPSLAIPGKKTYQNVRLEARPANVERDGRWDWKANPFVGKRELQGLKIMMALINNWDLKNDNTAILEVGGKRHYVVSDLGSSFGKLSPTSAFFLTRFGRSVNKPKHYADATFVKGVTKEGELDLAYNGKQADLMNGLTPEDARWISGLLNQLTTQQIREAFRAANYSPAEISMLSAAVKNRIAELSAVGSNRFEARR